jgi:hypothetical protein
LSRRGLANRTFRLTRQKNVTIKRLPRLASLLHLVCPHGQPRYYLLLTGIHRFLAPLFTFIPSLFRNLNPSHPDDPTQTRNSARVTAKTDKLALKSKKQNGKEEKRRTAF